MRELQLDESQDDRINRQELSINCLLYTSDAADEG